MLVQGTFFEPTEMTILPNLDILILQRRGERSCCINSKPATLNRRDISGCLLESKSKGVNAEEGMLGLSKDPDFENNHWVYIYYSPVDSP